MRNATACSWARGIIHARPPELFIIGIGRAISEAIRTKRAFFLPVDHTPRNPERSRRCQDELDTRVEPCARLVGSINRVVRYISHPAVRSARIPTLYLRGVAPPRLARGGGSGRGWRGVYARHRCNLGQSRISTLPEAVRIPRVPTARSIGRRKTQQHTIPSGLGVDPDFRGWQACLFPENNRHDGRDEERQWEISLRDTNTQTVVVAWLINFSRSRRKTSALPVLIGKSSYLQYVYQILR